MTIGVNNNTGGVMELRSSLTMSKGGAITQKGPGHSSDKKALKEQQMRAREKLLINNGGTVVLGSHSMPHAAMGPLQ